MFAVLKYDIARGWRSLVIWCVSLVAVLTLYSSFYPSMGIGDGLNELMKQLPQQVVDALGFSDISSGAGWVNSTFFSLLGLFILSGASIVWGSTAVAGAEESGFLELTLSRRVSRTAYYVARIIGMLLRFIVVGAIVFIGLCALNGPAELSLEVNNMLAQIASFLALGMLFGSISLAVGALTGVRQWSIGAGTAVVVLAYAFNMIGRTSDSFHWLQDCSPIYWAYHDTPLMQGWQLPGLAITLTVALLLAVIGLLGFNRRDLGA